MHYVGEINSFLRNGFLSDLGQFHPLVYSLSDIYSQSTPKHVLKKAASKLEEENLETSEKFASH